MLWRRRKSQAIAVGERFRRGKPSGPSQLAEVLAVEPDGAGIPHVHYRLRSVWREGDIATDIRTLAVSAFAQRYPERVQA